MLIIILGWLYVATQAANVCREFLTLLLNVDLNLGVIDKVVDKVNKVNNY